MIHVTVACIAIAVVCSGQNGQSGPETSLNRALDDFIAATQKESDDQLSELSGKVFGEFSKTESTNRRAAVRKLVDAYVRAREMRARMLPYVMLHRLPVTTDELALAVADKLFDGDEAAARQWGRVLSDKLGGKSLSGYVDLRDFEARLGTFPANDDTRNVLRFLFQKSPSSALLLLAAHHVPGKEEYDLAVKDRRATTYLLRLRRDPSVDKTEATAIGTLLRELAESPHSWVRLYVVEMMIQNPALRDESLVEKLAADKDPLVLLAIADMRDPKGRVRHGPVRTPWME